MTGESRSPGEAAKRQLFRAQEVRVDGITSADEPNVRVCLFLPVSSASWCVSASSIFFSFRSFTDPGSTRGFKTQRCERLRSSLSFQNPQHLLIMNLFWCSAHRPQRGYYPNKWLWEV